MNLSHISTRPALVVFILLAMLSLGCSEVDRLKVRATLGGADSQLLVGHAYETGKGVKQDPKEAMRWYRKAAEQGHPKAFGLIGRLYGMGFGVKRDLVKANMYFKLGVRRGEKHLVEYVELVEQKLKTGDIKKSVHLADSWEARH
jgi:TPR repeat protein